MIFDDEPDDQPYPTDPNPNPTSLLACVGLVLVIIALHYFELFGLSFQL